jgi:hypothetical protein
MQRMLVMNAPGVKRLQKLGMVSAVPGMAALDMNSAEDAVVRHTREVVPGMVICGMEVRSRHRSVSEFLTALPVPMQKNAEYSMAVHTHMIAGCHASSAHSASALRRCGSPWTLVDWQISKRGLLGRGVQLFMLAGTVSILLVSGFVPLQVAELDGCPRMGPTFGAMFMSGQKAAHCALNSLRRQQALNEVPAPPSRSSDKSLAATA